MPWSWLSLWKWVPGISSGVKAAGAFGWRPTTLVVPKVRGLNLPGTPRATSACHRTPLLYFYPLIHLYQQLLRPTAALQLQTLKWILRHVQVTVVLQQVSKFRTQLGQFTVPQLHSTSQCSWPFHNCCHTRVYMCYWRCCSQLGAMLTLQPAQLTATKIKTFFNIFVSCNIHANFSESQPTYEILWKYMAEPNRPQTTK